MRSGTTDDRLVGGRYRLGEHLGSGGMGTVWCGRDELLERDVAVKEVVIPDGMPQVEGDKLRQRYLREARAAARLRHAHAVGVYDVLPEAGRVWIVMEYVEAKNLADVVRDTGPLSPQRAAQMGRHLLDALTAAHAAGVLHRDVKPANVLLSEDRTVLTDFGVASVAGDPSLTGTGQVIGSPAYLSPERLMGQPAGPPSDLWSLGCTLYAAVEGAPPFLRDEPFAVITAITLEPVPPPRRAGHLAPVLAGLLEKDPAQRWDAARTRAALDRVAAGQAVEATAGWGSPASPDQDDTLRVPSERPPSPEATAPISG
ncbi:MAG TPA: serine/threonine-protein kinase, partial [Cryptosporangiaceae bacterium]|nr:serine/threonine-protein kinase [Cryptosporangiaceae bacterium]